MAEVALALVNCKYKLEIEKKIPTISELMHQPLFHWPS